MSKAPEHPGSYIAERFLTPGLSCLALAQRLNMFRQVLHKIINGERSITPIIALKLERYTGIAAEEWLRRQAVYDLGLLRETSKEALAGIKPVKHHR